LLSFMAKKHPTIATKHTKSESMSLLQVR
jgi:hypothetical protein